MSSAQTTILTAIETRTNSVISAYSRLKYSYDLESNSYRDGEKGYGIGAGTGSSVEGTTQTITMDQSFFVVLTRNFGGRQDDNAERIALKSIYDDLETLYRDLFQSKLGIASTVYLVSDLDLEEPTKIAKNVISIKMNFMVKHRKAT
jgi:hypothetical protein